MIYTKGMWNESHPGADNGALYWKQNGRAYEIIAIREGEAAANAFMAEHPGVGVIAEIGASVVMVANTDLGQPFSKRQLAAGWENRGGAAS